MHRVRVKEIKLQRLGISVAGESVGGVGDALWGRVLRDPASLKNHI